MEKTGINWTQTRINIATAAMQSLLANQQEFKRLNDYFELNDINPYEGMAIEARCYADALIEQLKTHPLDSEGLKPDSDAELIAKAREISIERLGLATRTYNALHLKGINTAEKLMRCTPLFLQRYCRNFGGKSLREIEARLAERGYKLATLPPYWVEYTWGGATEAHLSDLSQWKSGFKGYRELEAFIETENKKIFSK